MGNYGSVNVPGVSAKFEPLFIKVTFPLRSNKATLRHTLSAVCRCFLPDLTGFTGLRCTRPNSQHASGKHFFINSSPHNG